MRVVRAGRGVVRTQDGHRGQLRRPAAEHRVLLGTRVRGVHHRAVDGAGLPGAAQRQQDLEAARYRRRARGAPSVTDRQQPGCRLRAEHHVVGLHARAVRQLDPRRPAVLLGHPDHLGAEDELHLAGQTARVHRVGQGAHTPGDVPAAEGLLHVRQERGGRRGPARVQAVRQRVSVEQGRQPGVRELPGAHLRHRPRLPGGTQQPAVPDRRVGIAGQCPPVLRQRLLQQRPARPVPGLARPVQEVAPPGPGPLAERPVQRTGHTGPRGVGQRDRGAVREEMAARRVDLGQRDALLQALLARLHEQVAVDRGQMQQPGAGVEDEAVTGEPPERAAVGLRALVHRHPVACHGEPGSRRHRAGPGADHRNSCHVSDLTGCRRQLIRAAGARPSRPGVPPPGAAPGAAGTSGSGKPGRAASRGPAGAGPRRSRPPPPG